MAGTHPPGWSLARRIAADLTDLCAKPSANRRSARLSLNC